MRSTGHSDLKLVLKERDILKLTLIATLNLTSGGPNNMVARFWFSFVRPRPTRGYRLAHMGLSSLGWYGLSIEIQRNNPQNQPAGFETHPSCWICLGNGFEKVASH